LKFSLNAGTPERIKEPHVHLLPYAFKNHQPGIELQIQAGWQPHGLILLTLVIDIQLF